MVSFLFLCQLSWHEEKKTTPVHFALSAESPALLGYTRSHTFPHLAQFFLMLYLHRLVSHWRNHQITMAQCTKATDVQMFISIVSEHLLLACATGSGLQAFFVLWMSWTYAEYFIVVDCVPNYLCWVQLKDTNLPLAGSKEGTSAKSQMASKCFSGWKEYLCYFRDSR